MKMFSILLLITLLAPALASPQPAASQAAGPKANKTERYRLHISGSSNRSRSAALESMPVLSGSVHIFVTPPAGISQVRFFLDHPDELLEDPAVAGTPTAIDDRPPFDFSGTDASGNARAFDTTQLSDGSHSLVAALDLTDGTTEVLISRFIVHNGPPALLFGPEPVKFKVGKDGRTSKTLKLYVGNGDPSSVTFSENAPWLELESPTPGGSGNTGVAPGYHTVSVDGAGLSPGTYSTTITASASGYESDSINVTMEVLATTCSPLACSEILVDLPYELNFSRDHGKILDANGVGTGFTYVDQPTNATGYIPQNLTVNTAVPGTFQINTTNGTMYTTDNAQDNALAVGIDAPSQVTIVQATLLNPPAGTGNSEQAGIWFGNDEENYVKVEVISTSKGTRVEYLLEQNGQRLGSRTSSVLNLSSSTVMLGLTADPAERTITAYFSVDGAPARTLTTYTVPGEFFSFDAAGIDPNIGTRSFGGVFATHRKGPAPLVYTFNDFTVLSGGSSAPPSGITFDRSSFPIPNPTSIVWGPDGRLYVTEMFGTIHAITLDSNKQVVADQVITTLGSRLTLGITVDPQSTASNVILWVSHSNPSPNNGELNSSMVTRLSGPGFTTRQDVITGLPRAIANHAINSIHFGPDGRLYIAQGGNTGAGAANTANTEFGTRAEQPLSAAFLVADVRAAGFDGTCATPEQTFAPAPCDVVPYATGLRNPYDFVWHSNGQVYAPDNGLGIVGTFPPTPTPPCEGFGDTTSYTLGGDNPGEQPDILVRIQPGKYYGHPNPYRNECVYRDGTYQGVSPLSNFVPPMYNLGLNKSANGTIEYKSNAFNGLLQGDLLITNYSVGDDITRIKLSADGLSIAEVSQLVGGFNDPLPIAEGPDGTLYVGEFGASQVTVLVPEAVQDIGSWSPKQNLPAALLDVGGTALDGKLYVVMGKTSTGPVSTLHIYDPGTNSWTAGASVPAAYPSVENPSVVAYNSKLYVFGGSTSPFSGAVANAAVYDPSTSSWTMLAPMPTARGGAVAQEINGKIYVAGGMDGSGASVTTVEVYDPATNTWSSAASMGTARDNPGSAALGGKLYVFGGRTRLADGTEVSPTLNTVEMYDPATNTWTPRASMPTGRRTMVVGTLNGMAQVMGGERTPTGGTFSQNEEYDPAADSWRALSPMTTPRHGAAAGTIGGVVYVAGGGDTGGSSFTNVHEAFAFSGPAPTAPETTIDSGPTGTVNSSSASFTFSSSDPAATFECSLDGAAFSACTSPVQYTGLSDGEHTFQVRAKDADGNIDPSPSSRTWTVDTTAPAVSSVSPVAGATDVAVTVNVEAVFSEAVDPTSLNSSTFTLVNQSTQAAVTATITYDSANRKAILNPDANLNTGTGYTATVKGGTSGVKDTAGNALAQDFTWAFTTSTGTGDTTPPETTIDSGPSGTVSSSSAAFTFSSSEAGSTFECSLDGAAFSACASPAEYAGLADGAHSFSVRAIDPANNVDPTPAVRNWTIDTSAGSIYSLLVSFNKQRTNPVPLDGMTVSGVIYVFTSPDTADISNVTFFLDDPGMSGSPYKVESSAPYDFAGGGVKSANPFSTTSVANGSHTITAAITLSGGSVHIIHATFTVSN